MCVQVMMGLQYGSIARKTEPRDEQAKAMDFSVLFDFDVRTHRTHNLFNFSAHYVVSFHLCISYRNYVVVFHVR